MIFLANDPQAAAQAGLGATTLPPPPLSASPSLEAGVVVRRSPARVTSGLVRPAQAWPFMSRCPDRAAGRVHRLSDLS